MLTNPSPTPDKSCRNVGFGRFGQSKWASEHLTAPEQQVHVLDLTADHCSRFVVVIGSERFKSGTNDSTRGRCNWLRNIVAYTIFITSHKSRQCYESAA